MGFEKMVNAIDLKEAAAMGLYQRPLTTAVIEKHLADLGIEPEFGTHSRIRGLSGEGSTFLPLAPHPCIAGSALSISTHWSGLLPGSGSVALSPYPAGLSMSIAATCTGNVGAKDLNVSPHAALLRGSCHLHAVRGQAGACLD